METRKVGIVDFCRSPISRAKGGALNGITGIEIATQVVKALVARNGKIPGTDYEAVVAGCAFPEAENGFNIGRGIVVKAGLPLSVAGITVNQFCASSQQAVMMLADAIALGKGEAGIAVGLEHMTRVPMGGFNPMMDAELDRAGFYIGMGATAENLVKDLEISREDQETYSAESHRKALAAMKGGRFDREIIPITLPDGTTLDRDECPMEPDLEKMKSLKPAFDAAGTITAATSSPVSTGAAAAILMSEDRAKALGIPLRATIVSTAVVGCAYDRMGMGPLPATEKALARAGLAAKDLDLIELNEAFAGQALYVIRKAGWPQDKVNVLGGAIALGHPLGMSGVRIIGTAITALEARQATHAAATMCVGGGQGATTILRNGRADR